MTEGAWANPLPEDTAKAPGLERVRAIWQRRKWLAIIAFALPFTAAISLVAALPRVYRSTVVVLVERQQVPEEFVRATVTGEIETRLQTITQEILSRSRLEGLINRFNLYADLRKQVSSEEVVERMRSDVRLELRSTADRGRGPTTVAAFALSYQGGDPRTVALVANTIGSFYIEENLKSRERQATGTAQFLKVQLEEAKRRLDDQERRVSAFQGRHMGELPQQMQSNITSLETLNAQLRLNSENQLRAVERREGLTAQLAEAATLAQVTPTPGGGVAAADPPWVRLARLRQELATASARYTETHPTLIRLKEELAAAERQHGQAKAEPSADATGTPTQWSDNAANPYVLRLRESLRGAEAELKVLKAEEQHLRAATAAYRARVDNTPRREQEFLDLSRDYDTTKAYYQSLVKRHEEAQLAESMEQRQKGEQFRVVEPAIASGVPAAPNRLGLLALGSALSAGLAVGVVMLAELLNTAFHSADELRALGGVPVLARIPWIVTEADARRRRRRFRLATAATVLALVVVASASYVVGHGNERLSHLVSRGA